MDQTPGFSNMAALHTIVAGGHVTPTKAQYDPPAGIGFRAFLELAIVSAPIRVDGEAIARIEAEIARLDRLYDIEGDN
jgi:hypothetical protein